MSDLIEELHGEPIKDVISRNQRFLGSSINPEETLVTLLAKGEGCTSLDDFDYFSGLVEGYLFSNDAEEFEKSEEGLRIWFQGGYAFGLPRFVVIHHPINHRDVFLTSKNSEGYLYVGKFYVGKPREVGE